jgi:protein-S-isoprenylcysteine O-methyltransferase Ste14
MVGILLQFMYPIGFPTHTGEWVGVSIITLASGLIFWAQITSDELHTVDQSVEVHTDTIFARGPYYIFRSPTHVGLLFLIIGFGSLINSVWVVVATLVGYVIAHNTFLKKEQEFLVKKYGEAYAKYRTKIRL